MKTFSNWPTFPQLYIDGDLIGGLDIIKEMVEAGEMQSMIPTKVTLEDRLKSLINKSPLMIFMKGDRKVNIYLRNDKAQFINLWVFRLRSVASAGSSWR